MFSFLVLETQALLELQRKSVEYSYQVWLFVDNVGNTLSFVNLKKKLYLKGVFNKWMKKKRVCGRP